MASSLINASQIYFDSMYGMDYEEMGKVVEITEEVFAGMFELLTEGLTEMSEVPKDLVFDAKSAFSMGGEQLKTSCNKREMKYEFCFWNDILAKIVTVKAGSFDVVTHERFLMMSVIHGGGAPDLDLGESKEFPSLKILTAKTVGTYVAKNKNIAVEEVADEPVVKKAAPKRIPAPVVGEIVAKKKRTTVGRVAPAKKDLTMVPVVQDPEPISIVPAVPPKAQRRRAPKRKLVLQKEFLVQFRERVIADVSSFFHSFSLHRLVILESIKDIVAKEEQMLDWFETDSLETSVKRRMYIIAKYQEKLLRNFWRRDEICTDGFSSSNWPEQIPAKRRRRTAAAAACEEERGGGCDALGLGSRTSILPPPMLNKLSLISMRESRNQYLCDPQWFRDTASHGPTTCVTPKPQFRTDPSDHGKASSNIAPCSPSGTRSGTNLYVPAVTPKAQRRRAPKRKLVFQKGSDDEIVDSIIHQVIADTAAIETGEPDSGEPDLGEGKIFVGTSGGGDF
ncbi:hypothetical protein F511_35402 [Dorcoceras hygrometricum]|uniref:Uncharacterized protein n=1 Tax=Dorcoceras hygrometricum TaxID=472368 RepID=A0A2Z7A5Y1_9LAMI|nr:hypothetical protein F511_35402 [Dorcoceras hygrometricum]